MLMAKKKEAKSEYKSALLGISPQGAAIFAPGLHPKDRQKADKAALEAGSVPAEEVPAAEAPVMPVEDENEDVGNEEGAVIEDPKPDEE